MSQLTNPITFTPAASVTLNPPVCATNKNPTMALPPVDPDNTAMTVQNLSGLAVLFQLGTAAVIPAGPTVPGCFRAEGGQTLLLQNQAGEATNIGLQVAAYGSIICTRGTATSATVFA